jgi:hypothetical protein
VGGGDAAQRLRDVVWSCRRVGWRCARLIALRAVKDITMYGPARAAADAALAPLVEEFRGAGMALLDAIIDPAATSG